ncbi:hypothetical protein ACLOJK_009725 [Asimina triloba]
MEMEVGMEVEQRKLKLNEDAVVEILCRLPKKSLARFKCVSKQWLRLISDRSRVSPKTTAATNAGLVFQCFVPPQHRRPGIDRRSPLSFLRVDSEGRARFARSTLPGEEEAWGNSQLFGSCDGFLLLRKETGVLFEDDYVVCDPATRRFWHLSPPRTGGHETVHVALVPAGGGSRHFKLVRYHAHGMMARSRVSFVVDVFSSQEEEWSRETWWSPPNEKSEIREVQIHWSNLRTSRDITCRKVASVDLGKSLFLGGDLHWSWEGALYICKLEAGTIRRIPFPSLPKWSSNHCIWESEGCLNYCYVSGDRIRIWSLLKGDDVWELKHEGILSLPPVSELTSHLVLPFAFNDDFEIVYMLCGTRVFSYQLWTREMKEACASPFEGDAGLCMGFPFSHFASFEAASATAMWDAKVCDRRSGKMLKT